MHAGNGQVVLTSERYAAKAGAMNGIESVRENAPVESRYAFSDDGLRFSLKARNGQVIGTSETYSSAGAAREGTQAVMRAAQDAGMDDQT